MSYVPYPATPDFCPEPFPKYVEEWKYWDARHFKCKVCNVRYEIGKRSYGLIIDHLKSQKHLNRMEQLTQNYCHICQLQTPTATHYRLHCDTQRHKDKEAGIQPNQYCEVCNLRFSCHALYKRHIATKAHARKLLPPPKRDCELCGIHVTTDRQMETHLATRKHQKKAVEANA